MTFQYVVDEIHATVDGSCVRKMMGVGIAIRVVEENQIVTEISQRRGYGTNNIAEYLAVIAACNDVKEDFSYKKLVIFTDSQLVFRQLKGEYKVRNKNLKPLHSQAIFAMVAAKAFLRWHPRDDGDGPIADKLANRAVGGNRGTRHRSEMDAAGHRTDASGEVGKGGTPSNTSAEDDKR